MMPAELEKPADPSANGVQKPSLSRQVSILVPQKAVIAPPDTEPPKYQEAEASHVMQAIAHLETRVGDTPLVPCPPLAKHLGLPNLFIKLEGTNPTGTQKDRIAHLEVKEAIARRSEAITAASCGNFGVAIAHAANIADLPCTIFVPEDFQGERINVMQELGAAVERVPGTYEDAVQASRDHAARSGDHNANPGGANRLRTIAGYAHIAEEILEQRDGSPVAVGLPIGNGTTLAGAHFGFRAAWAKGEIDEVPKIFGASSQNNNPVTIAMARHHKHVTPLDPRAVHETAVNEPLVNWDALDGEEALTAMRDSGGAAYGIDDEMLMELHSVLLQAGYDAHPASLSAVAALKLAVDDGLLDADAYMVAVLTSGRSTISVRRMAEPEPGMETVVAELREYLGRFGDPEPEVEEATRRAFENGFVLVAEDAAGRLGYTVLTPMPFLEFFPKYHLSYICVSKRARGRGVGSLLMEEAIRLTHGDLSLHVETDNPKAIRLYEKFGFHAKYYRMLYKGPTSDVDPSAGSGWKSHAETDRKAQRVASGAEDLGETETVTTKH